MAHPHVADGEDSLQIWKVVVNILSKQSQTANKEWSPSLGLSVGLTLITMKYKLGSLYRAGSLMTVAKALSEKKLDLVGVQDVR
jgi:hypothetical protein